MKITKAREAAILIGVLCLSMLSGCGQEEEEAYSSPTFDTPTSEVATENDSEEVSASISDAISIASFSDATVTDGESAPDIPASLTDAFPMGMYDDDNNVYYNKLAEFKISVDGNSWKFYDAVNVASATGATEDYINNLWYGYKSPHDEETTYAAIAYNKDTGSNIIVSYVNPEAYLMPNFSAKDYLGMAAERYSGATVEEVTFLGQKYWCMDVSEEETAMGRRTQFAIDKDGLIVLITITLQDSVTLEDAVKLMTPLYY